MLARPVEDGLEILTVGTRPDPSGFATKVSALNLAFADDPYLMRTRNTTWINPSRREDQRGAILPRQRQPRNAARLTMRELLSETAKPRGARSSNDPAGRA